MSSWSRLFSQKENAIGEVAAVEAGKIEIYIYPECYPLVHIGDILAINAEGKKPIGLVLKLAHTSRYGSFTPMKSTRYEIQQTYPDLDKYHNFVSTMVYTSHLSSNSVVHVRASMPRLHDLVYLVSDKDLLDDFFKPGGSWNLSFLKYYILEGAGSLELREFLYNHRSYFERYRGEQEEIIRELTRILLKSGIKNIAEYLEELCEFLRW